MKICRFLINNEVHYGTVHGNIVTEIGGTPFEDFIKTKKTQDLGDVKLLSPCSPSKIVAVGLNYMDHASEMDKGVPEDPMLFLKPGSSVIGNNDIIKYPAHMSQRVDYEGELAVVIKKEAKEVSTENATDFILGYTCLNDVTARDLQSKDGQFTRAKGFDSFAPIGPWIETELDPFNLDIKTFLNGEQKQNSNTSNLIFNVPKLINFITHVMTLYPGDVISTGTPGGIGPMNIGDKVEVTIEGIGTLTNTVGSN